MILPRPTCAICLIYPRALTEMTSYVDPIRSVDHLALLEEAGALKYWRILVKGYFCACGSWLRILRLGKPKCMRGSGTASLFHCELNPLPNLALVILHTCVQEFAMSDIAVLLPLNSTLFFFLPLLDPTDVAIPARPCRTATVKSSKDFDWPELPTGGPYSATLQRHSGGRSILGMNLWGARGGTFFDGWGDIRDHPT